MFKILKNFSILAIVFALFLSQNTNTLADDLTNFYTQDDAKVVNSSTKEYIKNINAKYGKTDKKPEIIVKTLDSLNGTDIESYSVDEFEKLQVGNKGEDNGVLIVVSINDRQFRIEVGYGLEGAITDIEAKDILDSSSKYFKNEDYSNGIKNIVNGVATKINDEYDYNIDLDNTDMSNSKEDIVSNISPLKAVLIGIFIIVNIFLAIISPSYRRFLFFLIMSQRRGGGGKGGGSSGGGRGSGGGRSGGGGASGGW